MAEAKNSRQRIVALDMMAGMAMILVVLGHQSIGTVPDWYRYALHEWIYSFHMELFVFVSGFVIRYSYPQVSGIGGYWRYIWKKIKKFCPWFLLIGMATALLESASGGIDWNETAVAARQLLLYPRQSSASFLWYIYILLGYYALSPLYFRLPPIVKTALCALSLLLPSLDAPHLLCAYDYCHYTFFYCLGALCCEWRDDILSVKQWAWGLMSMPFICWSIWVLSQGVGIEYQNARIGWWTTATGVASLPFFYLLAITAARHTALRKSLEAVARSSYWIYLLQMFVIQAVVLAFDRTVGSNTVPYPLLMASAFLLALTLPMLLQRLWLIKKTGPLQKQSRKNTSLK